MAKRLNVDLLIKADAKQAQEVLNSLNNNLKSIQNIKNMPIINDESYKSAAEAAKTLERNLQSAINVDTGKLDLNKFSMSLKKANTSITELGIKLSGAGATGEQAFLNLAKSIALADNSALNLGTKISGLMTTLKNTARWQISSSVLHGFISSISGAYHYAQNLNESLNNIRIVTGQTTNQMAQFAKEANNAAKSLSTTTTAYTDAALIYYQQGLSDEEVKARTDTTIKLANVSRQSAEEVSSQMTAIWNNFAKGGENLEYYADVITALGAATASSSDEIAEGLSKFASVADTVGLSYEKASAALATVVAETRQSADVVGTAFKTIFARIQGLSLGETLEDGVDLNKYSKALQSVGVNVLDSNKNLKDMDVILDELSNKWDNIGEAQRVALSETVAGVRQYSQFMALMNNYDKVQTNEGLAEGSSGTLQDQADIYAESWEGAQKRVQAALQEIYNQLLDDDAFINILNGFEKFLGFISNIIDGLGGIKGILLLIGSIFMQQYAKEMPLFFEKISQNLTMIAGRGQSIKEAMLEEIEANLILEKNSQMSINNKNNQDYGMQAKYESTQKAIEMTQKLNAAMKTLSDTEIEEYKIKIEQTIREGEYLAELGKELTEIEKLNQAEATKVSGIAMASYDDIGTIDGFENDELSSNTYDEAINQSLTEQKKLKEEIFYIQQDLQNGILSEQQAMDMIQQKTNEIEISEAKVFSLRQSQAKIVEFLNGDYKKAVSNYRIMSDEVKNIVTRTKNWENVEEKIQKLLQGNNTQKKAGVRVANNLAKEMQHYSEYLEKAIKKANNGVIPKSAQKELQNFVSLIKEAQQDSSKWDTVFATLKSGGGVFGLLSEEAENTKQEFEAVTTQGENMGIVFDTPEMENFTQNLSDGAAKAQSFSTGMQEMNENTDEGLNHTMKMSEMMAGLGSTIMQVSMGINALKNLGNIWSSEDLSIGEKILQTMTSIGMILPIITTLTNKEKIAQMGVAAARLLGITSIHGESTAHLASVGPKVAAGTAGWYALGPLLLFVAIAAAVVAALALITAGIIALMNAESAEDKAIREANEALEESKKVAKELANAAKEAKDKADKLKEAFDKYDTIVDKLNSCKKGTQEWRDTLDELNTQVRDMVAEYPELLQYLTELNNGAMGFSEEGQEEVQNIYNRKARQAANTAIMAQADVEKKNVTLEQKKLIKSSKKLDTTTTTNSGKTKRVDSTAAEKKEIIENADKYINKSDNELEEEFSKKVNLTGDALTDFVKQVKELGSTIKKTNNIVDNASTTIAQTATEEDYGDKTEVQKNTISNFGEAAYTATYNKVYKELMKKNREDYDSNSWDEDLNSNQDALWHRWLKAMGYEGKGYVLDDDALNGGESDRTVTFTNDQGEEKTLSYDLMAKQTAAGEAELEMSEAQKKVNELTSSMGVRGQKFVAGMEYKSNEEKFDVSKSINMLTDAERRELQEAFQALDDDTDDYDEWTEHLRKAEKGELDDKEMQEQYQKLLKLTGLTADEYIALQEGDKFDASDFVKGAKDINYTKAEAAILNEMDKQVNGNIKENKTYEEKTDFTQSYLAVQKQIKDTEELKDQQNSLEDALHGIAIDNSDNMAGLTKFQKGIQNIDLTSADAAEKVEKLAKENNLAGDGIKNFVASLDQVEHHFNLSSEAANEQAAELKKLTKDLNIGDTIDKEALETLQNAGINTDAYFTKMEDGTYQLSHSADEFKKAVDDITVDNLKNLLQKIKDSRTESAIKTDFQGGDTTFSNTMQEAMYGDGNAVTGAGMVESGTENLNAQGKKYVGARLNYAASFAKENPELFADLGDEAAVLLEQAQKGNLEVLTADQAELVSKMIDVIDAKQAELQEEYLSTATTLEELNARTAELADISGSVDYTAYSAALINLASQYDNTSLEIEEYEEALRSGDTAQLKTAEDALVAATMIGEASAKYDLVAEDVETQAKLIAKNFNEQVEGAEMSAQTAARLAIANQRLNKGVKNLSDNWEKWSTELKKSNHTTKDYAEALNDAHEALADLVGAVDGASIPISFLDNTTADGAKHLEWLGRAAKGDTQAINNLGVAVAKASLKEAEFKKEITEAQEEAKKYTTDTIEPMKNAFGEIISEETFEKAKNIVNEFMTGFENAVANGTSSAQSYLDNYGEDWVSALNEMAMATGMSVEEMNALLNELGVDVQVDTTSVTQKTKVPKYTTKEEIKSVSYHPDDKEKKYPMFEKESYTYQSGVEEVVETIEVPQINVGDKVGTPPKVNYVGTSANRGFSGGISTSSTSGNESSSSSSKNTSASSHEHEVNRYSNEENAIKGLSESYERLNKAKDQAFGVGRIHMIEQELKALRELKQASGDYLDTVAGKGNAKKIAEATYTGKNIGSMISSGQLGGTIKADYNSLYGGLSASGKRLEYTAKDSEGNEWLASDNYSLSGFNSLFGTNLQFSLDSFGNIQNKDSILNLLQNLKNNENDAYSRIADPSAGSTTEYNKRMAYLDEIKERIEQYGSTTELLTEKTDEYLDYISQLQEKNAELITEKMNNGVNLGQKTIQRLERSIKILGDSIYKSAEAMQGWFNSTFKEGIQADRKQGDSAIQAIEETAQKVKLYEQNPLNENAISPAEAAEILSTVEDTLDGVIDSLLQRVQDGKEYYGNVLDYWNNKLDAVNRSIENNIKVFDHLQNILGLLGRSTDYEAIGDILQGKFEASQEDYLSKKAQANIAKQAYEQAQLDRENLIAKGISDEALEAYDENVLQKALDDYQAKADAMYNSLEQTIDLSNQLFENEINKIMQESEDRLTGKWGSFSDLDSAMKRQQSISDEYLTKTNQIYETNNLLRKLSQDIDKIDSQIAKNKLKAFSNEIEAMQKQEKLSKSDLEIAKARYEVLQAQIALEEAQNAKSTVRLQRDNEGNYGYVYTADQEKTADAEQNLANKQNDLYNLLLTQAETYGQKNIEMRKEWQAEMQALVEQYQNDTNMSEEEFLMKQADINNKYREMEKAYQESFQTANMWLNQVGAEGQTEAWINSFDTIITQHRIFNDDSINELNGYNNEINSVADDVTNTINDKFQELKEQRDYFTEESKIDNKELQDSINKVTSSVSQLSKSVTGKNGLTDSMSTAMNKAQNLTTAFINQYSALQDLITKYSSAADEANKLYNRTADLINVQVALNHANRGATSVNWGSGASSVYSSGGNANIGQGDNGNNAKDAPSVADSSSDNNNNKKDNSKNKNNLPNPDPNHYYRVEINGQWTYVPGSRLIKGNHAKEFYYVSDGKKYEAKYKTGGYTGSWNGPDTEENGKLAFLHQKELVLNADDTENILDAVKLIRQISQTIDLQAMAYNNSAFGLAAAHLASNNQTLQQEVTIHAEFPNATDHNEIEEAFNNLVNRASQYANRY